MRCILAYCYWLENEMMKPCSISPSDHSEILEELISSYYWLDEIEPQIDEDTKKQVFFANHPEKFCTEHAKSAHII